MALRKDLTEPQVDLRSESKKIQQENERLKEERVEQEKIQAEKLVAQEVDEKKQRDGLQEQTALLEAQREVDKAAREKIVKAQEAAIATEAPMVPEGEYAFPKDFLWGTSTSAYQVEGGIKNDWSEWEVSEARLAELEKKGEEADDFICGQACDHYNKYEEDLDLAAGLNNNAVRLGIEWARVQPEKGTWDVTAINHYRKVLQTARAKGLKTVVTLWHWTNPIWLTEEGGWENKKVQEYFGEYVDFILQELGSEVDYWITLNEPLMHVFGGYLKGYFPPAKRNIFKAEKVFKNLAKGHKLAYTKIHKHFPKANVSLTALVNYFEAANYLNPIEQAMAKTMHYYWNHRFLSKTKKYLDFIGLDYYFHDRMVWYPPFRNNKNERVNDKGWEIYPEGILEVLRYLKSFGKPIFIMENGLADATDKYRANFIKEHLYYIHQAIAEGIDVRGYFHWSLLDNFEWAYGWSPKFGLYSVDRKTFKRTERKSAETYREICGIGKIVVK